MFDKMQDMMKQLQMVQRLMKDENFKALISHPKVQALLKDPEFQAAMKSQDMAKIGTNPKLASLMRDPEVGPLLAKINPQTLFQATS